MKPTVLLISELTPFPTHGGERLHLFNLIESLSNLFNTVVIADNVTTTHKGVLPNVAAWIDLPRYDTFLRAKLTNYRAIWRLRAAWGDCLEAAVRQFQPDVAWFVYGHWGQYVPLMRRYGVKTLMGTQNVQSELTRQRATRTPFGLLKLFTWGRSSAEKWHEQTLFARFDRVVSVSEADRRYHAQFVADGCSVLLPNYINTARYQLTEPVERDTQRLVMSGSFDNFQNRESLKWFLETVWPLILTECPQAELHLAGKGSDTLPAQLDKTRKLVCYGRVPSVAPYLCSATVAIVPLLYGSGTRLKILEAWACETPIVSTALGAAGLYDATEQTMLVADSAAHFAEAVVKLLRDATLRMTLATNGLSTLRARHSSSANTCRIDKLVSGLLENDNST